MAKLWRIAGMIVGMVVVGAAVFLAVHWGSSHLSQSVSDGVNCPQTGTNHSVDIQDNTMRPDHTQAALCDTLTITNLDADDRLVAFGPHDNHVPYDGVAEKLLHQGQSLTITLNQAGNFSFHDHLEDIATGSFTVAK